MSYTRLTPKMMLQLSAPHTWPATILPVMLVVVLALRQGMFDVLMSSILLLICVLMQSAVNTLNDYIDYVKGADSPDNQPDPTDAVLVYNKVNPKSALALCIVQIVVAFLLGVYVIYCSGWVPLAFAVAGVVIIALYSVGKTPISYLPIGEFVSGFTMGILMPLACSIPLLGYLDLGVALYCLPIAIGIGLIMMTNNTCDIEKDIEAERRTFPVCVGRERARTVYRGAMLVQILLMPVLCVIDSTPATMMMLMGLLLCYPSIKALWNDPLTIQTRMAAMPKCLNFNVCLGLAYCLSLAIGSATWFAGPSGLMQLF